MTGVVEDVTATEDESPTESAEPEPTSEATTKPSAPPTNKPAPTSTVTAAVPAPSESAGPTTETKDLDQASAQSIGTHPVTRILVILLLAGLGVAYYSKLRTSGRASK
ncbi:putative membrane protein [Arthrobacter sp. CAN_A2]|uniref:hypothetical protein n=1 Tax=Arthrobacter sp. CAN_A2 TaxID=2787718 RepID=UPI0018EF4AC8